MKQNFTMTVFREMTTESKLPNRIQYNYLGIIIFRRRWFVNNEIKTYIFNGKILKICRFAFWGIWYIKKVMCLN